MRNRIEADGDRQAAITRHMAEIALQATAAASRPVQWFGDPEWRASWLAQASEPLDRYARINERLLDGCEAAYGVIAEEFHKADPDFAQFVESGALEPDLADALGDAAAKYAAAGMRPTLEVERTNGQVLLVDPTPDHGGGFIATVVFRTREARGEAPKAGAAPAQGGADAEGAKGAEGTPAEGAGFEDHTQLWTFTADHPKVGDYVSWLRSTMQASSPHLAEDAESTPEPPVAWRLHDINFVLHDYQPPDGPHDPVEAVNELLGRAAATAGLSVAFTFILFKFATRERPRALPPYAKEGGNPGAGGAHRSTAGVHGHVQQQQQQTQQLLPPPPPPSQQQPHHPPAHTGGAARPARRAAPGGTRLVNQWGDEIGVEALGAR